MADSSRLLERLRLLLSSFPRTRESSDFIAAARKSLDSRVRGNDGHSPRVRGNDGHKRGEAEADAKADSKTPVYIVPKRRDGSDRR